MSEGRLQKADKDFTKEVDKQVPEAQKLARTDLNGAVEQLLALEKQTRQASDLASTMRLLIAIVTLCKDAGDWPLLNEQVLLLSKKHSQLRQATTKMVQTVISFLDETPNVDVKLSVIDTLRTVTEGKIFVEVERARVTRILSDIMKQQGKVDKAAEILCELQVETFGSMSRREKTDFILEQVALCIEKERWAQAAILSRKISTKYFARKPKKTAAPETSKKGDDGKAKAARGEKDKEELAKAAAEEDDVTDLKLRYYEQQILLAKQEDRYLDVCRFYREVLNTDSVEANAEQWKPCLQRAIYFVILAPYDNEQSDLLHRINQDARVEELPMEKKLLTLFRKRELMRWPLVTELFSAHLCATDIFSDSGDKQKGGSRTTGAGSTTTMQDKAQQRWADLRRRVIEHNVRVVAQYYTRIRTSRLQELLDLGAEETEKYISDLVTAKTIFARIDRPASVVSFEKPADVDDVLNVWSADMRSLLVGLEKVEHLIREEEMMARIRPRAVKA